MILDDQLAESDRSLVRRAVDWVFGYDFFISYAHADGAVYPATLRQKLEAPPLGFKVFLDREVFVAGDDLRRATRRRVRMSRKLIVVARPAALRSRWVRREVEVHLATGKTPILIDVNGSIAAAGPDAELADLARRADWHRINEEISQLDLFPSEHVVNEVTRSFKATRQDTKRQRVFGAAAVVFAGLALVATVQQRAAARNEQRAITKQVDLYVQNGMNAIADGYLWASAVWFTEALRTDSRRDFPDTEHRVRLASVQRRLPRLERAWFVSDPLEELRFAPSGNQLVTVGAAVGLLTSVSGEQDQLTDGLSAWRLEIAEDTDEETLYALVWDRDRRTELAVWRLPSGERLPSFSPPTGRLIDFSSAAARLLVELDDGGLQVLENPGAAVWLQHWALLEKSWRRAGLVPDGTAVVAAAGGRLWHRRTTPGAEATLLLNAAQSVSSFSFDRSSRYLAAVAGHTAHVWHLEPELTGPMTLDAAAGVEDVKELTDLDFNPDGEHMLVTLKRDDGSLVSLVWKLWRDRADSLRASPAGRIDHERSVQRWEFNPPTPGGAAGATAMGGRVINPFEKSARFSPDGRLIAAASEVDDFVRVWDWRSGRPVTPPLRHFSQGITSFSFHPDGGAIAVAGGDRSIRVWRIAIPTGDLPPIGHPDRVDSLAFSPDGSQIAFGGYQPRGELWDHRSGERLARLPAHNGALSALAFSPDGRLLATGGVDATVRIYEIASDRELCEPLRTGYQVQGLVFHSSTSLLAFVGKFGGPSQIHVWELPSCRSVAVSSELAADVTAAAWHPSGQRVAVRFRSGSAAAPGEDRPLIWDLGSGAMTRLGPTVSAEWIGFLGHGAVAWIYGDGHIEELSSRTGERLRAYPTRSPFRHLAAVSRDGAKLALSSPGGQVQILDRRSGEPLAPQLDHGERAHIDRAAFSADGQRLLTISREKVWIWSAATGTLLAPPIAHDVRVNDAVFDPEARMIAISSYPKSDGRAGSPSEIHFWSLDGDDEPVEIMRLRALVSSEHQVDEAGGFVPLAPIELRNKVKALGSRLLPAEQDRKWTLLWHEQQSRQGDDYGRQFHRRQIIRHLDRRIAAGPANPAWHRERAAHFAALGLYEEAVDDYDVIARLEPNDTTALTARASLLAQLGQLDEALADYARAIERSPSDPELRRLRAGYYGSSGRFDLALSDLGHALKIESHEPLFKPSWEDLRDVYQYAYLSLISGEPEQYRAACQRALLLLPSVSAAPPAPEHWNTVFYAAWACVLGQGGLDEQQSSLLRRALAEYSAASPDRRQVRNAELLSGALLVRTGRPGDAEATLRSADLPPNSQLFLVIALTQLARDDEANAVRDEAQKSFETLRDTARQLQAPFLDRAWPLAIDIAQLLAGEIDDGA